MLDSRHLGGMLDSRRLGGMLDSRQPTGMLDFRRLGGILSLVLPNRHIRGTFVGVCTYFLKCVQARFWKFLDFLKTKKNRSGLTSRLAAVSRLDLLYVSENRGFGENAHKHKAQSTKCKLRSKRVNLQTFFTKPID